MMAHDGFTRRVKKGVIMVMLAGMRKLYRNTMNILKEKVAQDFLGNKTDTPGCNR